VAIIGRLNEQKELQRFYDSKESEFVIVYGRRRVGKTFLVGEYYGKKITFSLTGLANNGKQGRANLKKQLQNFDDAIARQFGKGRPPVSDWFAALNLLRDEIEALPRGKREKKIIFMDEMPWLDTPRSDFLTAIEHFWNSWAASRRDILLIVCGSSTSWIVKKLLKNRGGLHNRVTGRIGLAPFTLRECEEYCKSRGLRYGRKQIVDCYMAFGGVPFYLRQLQKGLSPAQNIDRLCFAKGAPLSDEFDEMYRSLFKSPDRYIDVVRALAKKTKGLTREEIADALGLSAGGTLTGVLSDLHLCGFIDRYREFTKEKKGDYYKLVDPFTLFYLKFMDGAKRTPGFWSSRTGSAARNAWSGLSFELVCLLHVDQIRAGLGIAGVAADVSAWRSKHADPGAQIDLVIERRDSTINLCEMKYTSGEYAIDKRAAADLLHKMEVFTKETCTKKDVHLTLVTTFGLKQNMYSDIVQSEVTLDDLFA
jgi:AAA+ ATPase superfamily predicted ATPase